MRYYVYALSPDADDGTLVDTCYVLPVARELADALLTRYASAWVICSATGKVEYYNSRLLMEVS